VGWYRVRQVLAGADGFLQSLKIRSVPHLVVNPSRIEKRANRVAGKISRCPHLLAGFVPATEIIALELDVIALRILRIQRNRQTMVETERGLNAILAQPVIRRHQIVEAVVLKGCVVHTVVADLLRIIGKTWHSQE
jgi:hypothetical protein